MLNFEFFLEWINAFIKYFDIKADNVSTWMASIIWRFLPEAIYQTIWSSSVYMNGRSSWWRDCHGASAAQRRSISMSFLDDDWTYWFTDDDWFKINKNFGSFKQYITEYNKDVHDVTIYYPHFQTSFPEIALFHFVMPHRTHISVLLVINSDKSFEIQLQRFTKSHFYFCLSCKAAYDK